MKKIVIGSRGSKLALIQTDIIAKKLQQLFPKTIIEVKIITTKGDKNMSPVPLDSIGKGWFTKEIDKALLDGTIDIAVHSLKDLPEVLPVGLTIAAIPEREDAREALVTKGSLSFRDLKKGSVVGTDSTRRKAQILHKRPDLVVESVRGNVNTRLDKLDSGQYDALFLAVAGLKRLGLEGRISEFFSVEDVIPSPGQGALAVVIKKSNASLLSTLRKLNHPKTLIAISAERVFSKAVGGGCKLPVGVYAESIGDELTIHGVIGSLDGKCIAKESITGKISSSAKLAKNLATRLLTIGKPWYVRADDIEEESDVHKKYVVTTRPVKQSKELQKKIEALGFSAFSFPSISIRKGILTEEVKAALSNLKSYDWIVFTSRNGVNFFMEALHELCIDISLLKSKKIAAVGQKTADELKKYNISVNFIPSSYTTKDLAQQLKEIENTKMLLPRANIASKSLTKNLVKRGALVTNIAIYNTTLVQASSRQFEDMIANKAISCITFTSPSTVEGFLKNIRGIKRETEVFSLPVISIGPVTSKSLKKHGFSKVYTAEVYTISGLLRKLKETHL